MTHRFTVAPSHATPAVTTYAITNARGAVVGHVDVETTGKRPMTRVRFPDVIATRYGDDPIDLAPNAWGKSPKTRGPVKMTAERAARITAAIEAINRLTVKEPAMSTPADPFAPALAYVRNLPEAGSRLRSSMEREAEIIARVTAAMASATRELTTIRDAAEREVTANWTAEDIAEAKAAP